MQYLLVINALGLLLMLIDKEKAKRNFWRIPEAVLLTIAAVGGSGGVFLGMYAFRHKTRKEKFYLGVPMLLLLHIILFLTVKGGHL